MNLFAKWERNSLRPVCPYCDSKDFSDLGCCNNCGYFLPVKFSASWPPKINRTPRAIEFDIHGNQCYICGQRGQEFGAFQPESIIDKMAYELLLGEPEGKAVLDLAEQLFKTREPIIATCILAAQRQKQIILFPAKAQPIYAAEIEELKLENLSFCLDCARTELLLPNLSMEEVLQNEISEHPEIIEEYPYYEEEEDEEEELAIYNAGKEEKDYPIYNRR